MEQVPTTKVYTDAFAELKKMKDHLSVLKQERDILINEKKEALAAVEDLNSRIAFLGTKLQDIAKTIVDVSEISKDIFNESVTLVRDGHAIFSSYKQEVEKLTSQIEGIKNGVITIDGYKDSQLEILAKERIDNENLRSDLNIYKARLEKIIKDNNLDMKII